MTKREFLAAGIGAGLAGAAFGQQGNGKVTARIKEVDVGVDNRDGGGGGGRNGGGGGGKEFSALHFGILSLLEEDAECAGGDVQREAGADMRVFGENDGVVEVDELEAGGLCVEQEGQQQEPASDPFLCFATL